MTHFRLLMCSVTVVLWDFRNEKKFKHVSLLIKLL